MYRCENFFVIGDAVKNSELVILWVKLMHTTLIHSELQVWFFLQIIYG